MSSIPDHEQDAQKRGTKNIKGLWRDAFRALKTPTGTSGTADEENRSVSEVKYSYLIVYDLIES